MTARELTFDQEDGFQCASLPIRLGLKTKVNMGV